MIDVIIPAYNAHKTIKDALYSIAIQTIKDKIKVYIVDDCSDKDYKDSIKGIDKLLDITLLKTPKNSGPGFAREYGIKHSSGDYIVFLDADDMFYNCFSIEKLYNYINDNNYNAVCSNFIEECDYISINHGFNDIWMHGKIYRRSFIVDNNIKFSNTYQNEDTGFNHIISLIDEFKYLDETTYIWRLNNNSITRKNDYEYTFNGLEGYIYNICYSIEEAIKKNVEVDKISSLVISTMYEMYFNYLKYSDYENVNLLFEWLKGLKKLFLEYNNKINNSKKYKIIKEETHNGIEKIDIVSYLNNKFTFDEFLDSIEED